MEGRRPRSPKRASMSRNIQVGGLEAGGSEADVDGAGDMEIGCLWRCNSRFWFLASMVFYLQPLGG